MKLGMNSMRRWVGYAYLAHATVFTIACDATPSLTPEGSYISPDASDAEPVGSSNEWLSCPSPTCTNPAVCICSVANGPGLNQPCQGLPNPPPIDFSIDVPAGTVNPGWDLDIADNGGCAGNYICMERYLDYQGYANSNPFMTSTHDWTWKFTAPSAPGAPLIGNLTCLNIGGGRPFVYKTTTVTVGAGAGEVDVPVTINGVAPTVNTFTVLLSRWGNLGPAGDGTQIGWTHVVDGQEIGGGYPPHQPILQIYSGPGGTANGATYVTIYSPNGVSLTTSPIVVSSTSPQLLWQTPQPFACGFRATDSTIDELYWQNNLPYLGTVPNASAYCIE